MSTLLGSIEAILFVASAPLTITKIAKALGTDRTAVMDAIGELRRKYNREDSGIHLLEVGERIQMTTNAAYTEIVERFVKYDIALELTKAQLETLTVIAYMGPVTRPEIEEIRGVNCALILRNLMIRGLILESDLDDRLVPVYELTMEALAELGVTSPTELPKYDTLHDHENIRTHLSESLT